MYVYDDYDQKIIEDRVKQFRDQTRRYLAGELSEEEFRPLRLQNGLYVQRFAPMLRVAVPYGQLTSRQARMMAKIARDYDKGYAHISTRQNVQFKIFSLNWQPCRCTLSRPAATACATSPPTSLPVWRRTNW
ncbi:Sulfite reductase hemoprotein, beta-component [Pseudomonas syringae pv. syringae]|nr:Sulfite reductase hemoprotein, beta-component [Pseudomonas syringae pv. syringae]